MPKNINKKILSTLDIITLNKIIFGEQDRESISFNQRHRTYCEKTIIEILEYQKEYHLNSLNI
ncbi:hypothetical protein [Chryseobacterium sp. 'Rf worker isolate 10']|jgi:hypothetical protein|uniref:hypothetical protein n=1 Tax=Chryseobacterium sp. 'Rf worker isolate 10' TaxID=2887348 RepID=UPI003D6EFC2F